MLSDKKRRVSTRRDNSARSNHLRTRLFSDSFDPLAGFEEDQELDYLEGVVAEKVEEAVGAREEDEYGKCILHNMFDLNTFCLTCCLVICSKCMNTPSHSSHEFYKVDFLHLIRLRLELKIQQMEDIFYNMQIFVENMKFTNDGNDDDFDDDNNAYHALLTKTASCGFHRREIRNAQADIKRTHTNNDDHHDSTNDSTEGENFEAKRWHHVKMLTNKLLEVKKSKLSILSSWRTALQGFFTPDTVNTNPVSVTKDALQTIINLINMDSTLELFKMDASSMISLVHALDTIDYNDSSSRAGSTVAKERKVSLIRGETFVIPNEMMPPPIPTEAPPPSVDSEGETFTFALAKKMFFRVSTEKAFHQLKFEQGTCSSSFSLKSFSVIGDQTGMRPLSSHSKLCEINKSNTAPSVAKSHSVLTLNTTHANLITSSQCITSSSSMSNLFQPLAQSNRLSKVITSSPPSSPSSSPYRGMTSSSTFIVAKSKPAAPIAALQQTASTKQPQYLDIQLSTTCLSPTKSYLFGYSLNEKFNYIYIFMVNKDGTLTLTSKNKDFACKILSTPDFPRAVGSVHMTFSSQKNRLYVSDIQSHRIHTYTLTKDLKIVYLSSFGSPGRKGGEFFGPGDILADNHYNLLFVADTGNNRISMFDISSNINESVSYVCSVGHIGKSIAELNWPCGMCIDERNSILLVSDKGNSRISTFNFVGGKELRPMGSLNLKQGRMNGSLYEPFSLLFDSLNETMIVLDHADFMEGDFENVNNDDNHGADVVNNGNNDVKNSLSESASYHHNNTRDLNSMSDPNIHKLDQTISASLIGCFSPEVDRAGTSVPPQKPYEYQRRLQSFSLTLKNENYEASLQSVYLATSEQNDPFSMCLIASAHRLYIVGRTGHLSLMNY